uniref:Forkhead box R1 n=1 Tax=Urocitellus parryii TaxID=9999 RepID=A0A8D2H3Y4_UROPR
VDLKLQNLDFWDSLHGQVPGLLDWDMGNESFLAFTTAHLPLTEQNLARYKLRIVEPPKLPLEKNPNADEDGPDIEPNLWMWVKPNDLISEFPSPQPLLKEEDSSCLEVTRVKSLLHSSSEQSPPRKQFASSPSNWELPEEEEAKDQDDSSSVALCLLTQGLPSKGGGFPKPSAQREGLWSQPPLNYFHLIALALRNSPPCGLNVQQIYSFTRQHFPFFRTAPEGWKNTVRHNLCFRDSFEKVPVSMQGEASTRPRSCLWKLTEEGHRRFAEEARALASTRLESIQQCMSQPDVMPFLFDLEL